MHKRSHWARTILLGLYACGDDSDESSPSQSSDAAARDTGTIGASETSDATGEVIVRGVRYWEILIGRVGLREVSVFGCCRSTSNKVALRASSGLPADTWLPGFVPSSITQWRPWAMRIDHPKLSAMFPRPRMKTSGQNGGSGGHRVQEVPLLQALTKRVTLRFNV
jgi:hypothetical protein